MATTTNYGWTTPDDTALVKDGASAIRALGTAIDTSMNTALGTKKSGLVLLNTTSFSAVASQSINSVFTSTYENYRIIYYDEGSGNLALYLRLRSSGTDTTGTVYDVSRVYNVTSTPTSSDEQDQTTILLGSTSTLPDHFFSLDLLRPQLAKNTYGFSNVANVSTSAQRTHAQSFRVVDTVQYDGLTFYTSTGTVTGSISIYGYNK